MTWVSVSIILMSSSSWLPLITISGSSVSVTYV